MRRLALVVSLLFLSACSLNVDSPPDNPSDPATETFASSLNIDLSTMTKTSQGVYYKDLKVGGGGLLTDPSNAVVGMQWAGYIKTGSLFNTEDDGNGVPLASAPPGLQDGMIGMREGGERVIVVPSALGFGDVAVNGVPPNSTLIFDVALEQIY